MDHSLAQAIVNDTDDRIAILDAKIADLRETIDAQKETIESLEKKSADAEHSKKFYYDQHLVLDRELNQLHQLIDLLPNSPPRTSEPPEDQSWNKVTYTVANRLTAWIATLSKR